MPTPTFWRSESDSSLAPSSFWAFEVLACPLTLNPGAEDHIASNTALSRLTGDDVAKKHGDICFSDIDGTLAWQDPKLVQELHEGEQDLSPYPNETVAQAIRTFVANGNKAFICTGRTRRCIHPKPLELPWAGVVCLTSGYADFEVTEVSPRKCTKRAGIRAVLDAPMWQYVVCILHQCNLQKECESLCPVRLPAF